MRFWVLDASYSVSTVPEVRLFVVTEDGERAVLLDRSFRPYFYVDCDCDLESLRAALSREAPIERVEWVERKIFGRPRRLAKVTARVPVDVRRLREAAREVPGVRDVYEADVRFYMRYMVDMGVYPCSWHSAEVEPAGALGGLKAYLLRGEVRREEGVPPPLRVLAFDIEVYNERGSPDPARDPVLEIAVKAGDREELFEAERDDREALRSFVEFVRRYDPDVVVGYNSNGFDWPYLAERARALGVPLRVDRLGGSPQPSVYGHWSVAGRANVDLYNIVDEFPEIKLKSLDRVAEYFGVVRRDERVLIPGHKIYLYWRDPAKRPLLRRYALDDVRSTYGLAERLLPFLIQLSSVSGLPLDQVAASSVGGRVEWMLMRYAYQAGEVAPNREEREYEPYRGAMVLEPRPGLYSDVVVLDFTSMYPNIMMKYNLSPDTLAGEGEVDVYVAPEVGHRFRKSPEGFIPRVLRILLELRRAAREEARKYPQDSPEFRVWDERQRALKVMANAMYGYLGWVGARWYAREVAESVTAFARAILADVISQARRVGLSVIYGDTDSLFLHRSDGVEALVDYVWRTHGIEVKVDKEYVRLLFTESKKRYAGLLRDGRIDIVGFEVVRGDWCELAKEVQLKVIEAILSSRSADEARRRVVEYVRGEIGRIREGRVELDDLIIWKTLDKELDQYKVVAPHVAAAMALRRRGYRVGKGSTVGYVVVRGGGRVSERAVPYIFVEDLSQVDVEYYVERQVVPAALRIAEVVGVRGSDLLGGPGRTLADFF